MAIDTGRLPSAASATAHASTNGTERASRSALARGVFLAWNGSPRAPDGQDAARLLHLVESVSDFVGIVGPDNRMLYVNPAGRVLLGIGEKESVTVIRLPDLHPPAMAKRLENEALPAALREGLWSGESAVLTRAGREIDVSQVVIPRRAPDGHLDSVAIVMHDIREGKRTDAALRESEDRFRLLAETMNEGYGITDRHGVLVFVNDGLARMLGCSPSDMIGHALLDFVDRAERDSIAARFALCAQGDRLGCDATLRSGQRCAQVRLTLRRIAPEAAGAAGVCVIVDDVSARTGLARALDASRENLRSLSLQMLTTEETERKRIAADLHDGLGQSFSALKFGIEYALSALSTHCVDEARDTLQSLLPKAHEALDEVRRMAMNLRPSTLDDLGLVATLSWLTRDFQAIYRPIAVETDVRVAEADVPDGLKVTIFRIVQEALNNVAKHSRASRVSVSLTVGNDLLLLAIVDNGVGFDPREVALRSNGERRHGYAGLRDRMEFSGGTLAIDAAPGAGVALRMSWPRAPRAGASTLPTLLAAGRRAV